MENPESENIDYLLFAERSHSVVIVLLSYLYCILCFSDGKDSK